MCSRAALSGLLAIVCAFLFILPVNAETSGKARKLEVIALLQSQDFEALERLYGSPDKGVGAAPKYWYFAHSDPANEAHLSAWIEAYPKSATARLARGFYYEHLAWLSRGSSVIGSTRPGQLKAMSQFFGKAQIDLNASINLDPSRDMGYAGLMTIALATGNDAAFAQVVRKGLDVAPLSVEIHHRIMARLHPRWGGSLDELREYVLLLRAKTAGDPRFDFLKSYMSGVLAYQAHVAGQRGLALAYVDSAIAQEPTARHLAWRARLSAESDSTKALADLDLAVAQAPDNGDYRLDRADNFLERKEFSRALEDAELAMSLDPFKPKRLTQYARIMFAVAFEAKRDGRVDEFESLLDRAFLALERTKVYGGSSTEVDYRVGLTLANSIFGYQGREEYIPRALQAAPDNSLVWAVHTRMLAISQQCDRREEVNQALRTFQKICRGSGCNEGNDLPGLVGLMDRACGFGSRGRPNDPVTKWKEKVVQTMRPCRQFYDEHDYAEAFERCLAVAQSGDAAAQLDVSLAYMARLGVAADFAAAAQWAERAAEQGDAAAQGKLGQLYVMGTAGEGKIEEGLTWIQKAIEQDSAEGYLGMAIVYHEGISVAKHDEEVIAYLERAVELGSEEAAKALEVWYAKRG